MEIKVQKFQSSYYVVIMIDGHYYSSSQCFALFEEADKRADEIKESLKQYHNVTIP